MNGIFSPGTFEANLDNASKIQFPLFSGSAGFMTFEKSAFVLVNVLDILLTTLLLQSGPFYESNPIANYILQGWGFEGMAVFKLIVTLGVLMIANAIASRKLQTSRKLLWTGTAIIGLVVMYSFSLLVS